jgi:hypothetical protein
MLSIADRILSVELKTETIEVPEWGVKLGIRELDASGRVAFAEDAKRRPAVAVVRLIIGATFDPETGKPVFEPAHQDALLARSGAVVDRIATEICRISGLTDGAAEALEKN